MARQCTENRAPSSSCIDRAGLGLLMSPELMERGLARHQVIHDNARERFEDASDLKRDLKWQERN